VDSACSRHGAMSSPYDFRPKHLKGRDRLEEIGVVGRIVLKRILKTQGTGESTANRLLSLKRATQNKSHKSFAKNKTYGRGSRRE
jgi:hypothetical protein